ncbi:oxidoreductase [Chitinimonas arctica]|uniref:Oxidoreductase n=1 Tax=Chitinimonas arctica TaxID=2594795 RepID=A0A516SCG1_9NEIS|nr:oxidoreductase-like domain-containing protein [Chitinimonas arctica]QDQ25839.1 oxidoreductase [Chitinimonas arctica]
MSDSPSAWPADDPPPEPPIAPPPEACCGSGCDPCIFDFYSEEVQQHRLLLAQWQARQALREHTKPI